MEVELVREVEIVREVADHRHRFASNFEQNLLAIGGGSDEDGMQELVQATEGGTATRLAAVSVATRAGLTSVKLVEDLMVRRAPEVGRPQGPKRRSACCGPIRESRTGVAVSECSLVEDTARIGSLMSSTGEEDHHDVQRHHERSRLAMVS